MKRVPLAAAASAAPRGRRRFECGHKGHYGKMEHSQESRLWVTMLTLLSPGGLQSPTQLLAIDPQGGESHCFKTDVSIRPRATPGLSCFESQVSVVEAELLADRTNLVAGVSPLRSDTRCYRIELPGGGGFHVFLQ
jgi:hypothetical protein